MLGDCRVLLLGGASGSGKSTVAQRLARRWDAHLLAVDDLRVAIESTATGEDASLFRRGRVIPLEPAAVAQNMLDWGAVASLVSRALSRVITMHVAYGDRMVIEGDCILPTLISTPPTRFFASRGIVRMVLIATDGPAQMRANLTRRNRGFVCQDPREQSGYVAKHWTFAQWLADRAAEAGVPVVRSGSLEALEACVIAAARGRNPPDEACVSC